MEIAKQKGAKRAVMLPMSIPAHSSLMRPAAAKLGPHLRAAALRAPTLPVVHNYDTSVHPSVEEIRLALEHQMYNPVRWADTIKTFAANGVTHVIECGPGKVLASFTKRVDPNLGSEALADAPSVRSALESTGASA
jgi:[acyl-carrier-protein] S-malonyltransferase